MNHSVVDMMGRTVVMPRIPQRIISLVPSQTEFLFSLGLADRIVGVTKFCVHPEDARKTAIVIGGTKQLDVDRLLLLKPDLVIGNKEENDADSIHALEAHVPVWMSDIYTLADAYHMMEQIGALVQKRMLANQIVHEIKVACDQWLADQPKERRTALYLIWANPWMAAAKSTFIDSMMDFAGTVNVLDQYTRYPMLVPAELKALAPDLIMLSSEPYPFQTKHKDELRILLPVSTIVDVDGEMFSWYGSRLAFVPDYFRTLTLPRRS